MGNSPTYIPTSRFDRWYEDRRTELELTHEQVLTALAPYGISKYMLTNLINNPERARPAHVKAIVEVLEVKNWFPVLVEGLGFGSGCSYAELTDLLASEGVSIGLVHNVAA